MLQPSRGIIAARNAGIGLGILAGLVAGWTLATLSSDCPPTAAGHAEISAECAEHDAAHLAGTEPAHTPTPAPTPTPVTPTPTATVPAPAPPTGLTAKWQGRDVIVEWTPGAHGWSQPNQIERIRLRDSVGRNVSGSVPIDEASFLDQGVPPGERYIYRLRSGTDYLAVLLDAREADMPRDLRAVVSDRNVTLSWTRGADVNGDMNVWRIRLPDAHGHHVRNVRADAVTATDAGVPAGRYIYRLRHDAHYVTVLVTVP